MTAERGVPADVRDGRLLADGITDLQQPELVAHRGCRLHGRAAVPNAVRDEFLEDEQQPLNRPLGDLLGAGRSFHGCLHRGGQLLTGGPHTDFQPGTALPTEGPPYSW